MDRPKVSVIMPVYNSGKYLNKAIESVLSQTYEDFELVIVNDGSTDNSASICRKYAEKDKRIKFIDQKNKGVSAARNTALASVSGHNIAFVDSDDVIDKHFLEIMLREKEKSSAEIVMCSFERFSTDRPSFKDNNGAKTVTWNHDEALNNCYGA